MAASINDKITDTFSSANPNVAKVTGTRTALGATLTCDNLAGWPTGSAVHFSTYQLNTSSAVVAGTQIDWKGIVSGNSIGTMTRQAGATDSGNAIGDIVEMNPTASWGHDLFTAATAEHSQLDGTHTNITQADANFIKDDAGNELLKWSKTASAVNEVTIKNAATGTAPIIKASGSDSTAHLNLQGKGLAKTVTIGAGGVTIFAYDYVASGCVWTADAAGSTRLASMTSGVVVINGNPVTVAVVTSRTFTASKDTYIDVLDAGDGTGTVVYTEATNNAASSALAANSIRIGIIVTGATTIATAASVNQGQEDRILPIASSIAYTVTDSLGNLICPRDPQRKILGYRQIIAAFTGAGNTNPQQVTGLSCPVIVPTGRKVKIVFHAADMYTNTAAALITASIWDGVVNSGTQLSQTQSQAVAGASFPTPCYTETQTTPATSSKTYNAGAKTGAGADTAGIDAGATFPAFIKVELV